jgi:hypothetical protein
MQRAIDIRGLSKGQVPEAMSAAVTITDPDVQDSRVRFFMEEFRSRRCATLCRLARKSRTRS